jgi:hypothetical protein
MASEIKLRTKGHTRESFDIFSSRISSLASAFKRTNPEDLKLEEKTLRTFTSTKDIRKFGGKFHSKKSKATFANSKDRDSFLSTQNFVLGKNEDDLVKAFQRRQDEVFSRRAQPGISQTRLV